MSFVFTAHRMRVVRVTDECRRLRGTRVLLLGGARGTGRLEAAQLRLELRLDVTSRFPIKWKVAGHGWSRLGESNPRPTHYECVALTY